jgi:hypothetical protein
VLRARAIVGIQVRTDERMLELSRMFGNESRQTFAWETAIRYLVNGEVA